MVNTKRLKHPHLWFQSVFNSSDCNYCGSAVCIIGKSHEAPQQVFHLYCFILYHILLTPQAFCFLKCSLLARKICQMLVLAKINTLLLCSQMLAKTMLYPSCCLLSKGVLEKKIPPSNSRSTLSSLHHFISFSFLFFVYKFATLTMKNTG